MRSDSGERGGRIFRDVPDDLAPLRDQGSADEQALLRAAGVPIIPESQRTAILRVLEDRLSPAGRRRSAGKLAVVLAGTLVTGSALAYGVVQLREHATPTTPSPRRAPSPGATGPAIPAATPPPATGEQPRPAVGPTPPAARRRVARVAPPPSMPLGGPGLREPGDLYLSPAEPETSPTDAPAPAPPRLVITRAGHLPLAMVLAGDRVVGKLRDAPVALTVSSAQITGALGHHQVSLWLHGRHAEGTIGGVPVRFELAETAGGLALRGSRFSRGALTVHDTLVESAGGKLSWPPGCDAPLVAISADSYEGRCGIRGRVRVTLPAAWRRLPELPRLVLLSLFLPHSGLPGANPRPAP